MADLHVSWEDYRTLMEDLAVKVRDSGYDFNQIVCIARGGLQVGDMFSRVFGKPLAILFTSSYVEAHGTVRGKLSVSKNITMTTPELGDRVLLVDDLVDSGATLEVVDHHLRAHFPQIRELRTAVLWWKGVSTFQPDFHAAYLADSPWIHQPMEWWEQCTPQGLGTRRKPGKQGG
jgi:hypoxanthine phosphoribosyltransferase